MTTLKRLLLLGAAITLSGLILMFPARVAHHWFSPPELQVAGITGSIWQGGAAEATLAGVYLSDLSWSFSPWSLLRGRLAYEVAAQPVNGFVELDAAVGFLGTLYIDALNAALPISALAGPLRVEDVAGDVSLQLSAIRIKDGWPRHLEGRAAVANLKMRALAPGPVGDFQAEFQTSDEALVGVVEDVRGMLELAGTLTLNPDRSYALLGRVGATTSATDAVKQQLSFLGTPDARGLREFRIEGAL
ncbi:MAG: type II secretion system protein N [Woeseia sp.]|nr:type II secretion system protein N [Woeseia sp.]